MKNVKFKEIFKPALTLFLICLIASLLLAITNYVTKDKIAETQRINAETNRLIVLPEAVTFGEENSVVVNDKLITYFEGYNSDNHLVGYVFTTANKGYGGTVEVMTGIAPEGEIIKTVILAMDDETPGLGQNAGKDNFLSQFTGKSGELSWVKNDAQGNEINGVTSASFTSKSVIQSVNDALEAYKLVGGEE